MRKWIVRLVGVIGLLTLLWSSSAFAQETITPDLSALMKADTPFVDGDKILFLGDSITESADGANGYLARIRAAFQTAPHPQVTIFNAGVAADMVTDVQQRLEKDVLANHPDVVFIQIGVNDAWRTDWGGGLAPALYEAGLRDIISKLQQQGAVVVLATPTLNGELLNGGNKYDKSLDDYAAISRKVAGDLHAGICDLRTVFLEYLKGHNPDGKDSGILTTDGRHLSDAGNALLAQEAVKGLLATLTAEPLPVIHGGDFAGSTLTAITFRPGYPVTDAVMIHYTLDNTEPDIHSPTYTKPISITTTTTIKLRTFSNDLPVGHTLVKVYTRLVGRKPDILKNPTHGVNYKLYDGGIYDHLPDLTTMTPVATGTCAAPDLSVRKRDSEFSFLYTGFIEVPSDDMYTLIVTSDDGSKFWIGDKLMINNDGQHGAIAVACQLPLDAGKHAFTLGYMQGGGPFSLELRWSTPHLPEQIIPVSAYYRDADDAK